MTQTFQTNITVTLDADGTMVVFTVPTESGKEVLTMAKNRLCFSVAGEFGGEIAFESSVNVTYEQMAQSVNKEKVAELLFLQSLGYSAEDIEIITPEEYDMVFGGGEDG